MIKGRKVYDPLTNTWSTGYWVKNEKNILYPVWSEYSIRYSYNGRKRIMRENENDMSKVYVIKKGKSIWNVL